MNSKNIHKNKGFTLIEITIVLVIIGLIIGGILIGRSMIESSRINSQIQQIQKLDIMMRNFKDKFGALPGDSTITPTTGDGDGIIETNEGGAQDLFYNPREYAYVWAQLSTAGMIQDGRTYNFVNGSGNVLRSDIPVSDIEPRAGIIAYGITTTARNYYSMILYGTSRTNVIQNYAIKPAMLAAIDSKIDNGVATTGAVIARGWWGLNIWSTNADVANNQTGCLGTGSVYRVTTNAGACVPRIDMFSQMGRD